jgi:hypothetical protein
MADSLEGLASVTSALGGDGHAARLWGAAERLRAEGQSPLAPNEQSSYDRRVAEARASLGDDAAFDHAWHEGSALALEKVMESALEEKVEQPW